MLLNRFLALKEFLDGFGRGFPLPLRNVVIVRSPSGQAAGKQWTQIEFGFNEIRAVRDQAARLSGQSR